jgi:hypothetical protein
LSFETGADDLNPVRIEYSIDRKTRLLSCCVSGGFHLFAFSNYLYRLLHDPLFSPSLKTLIVVADEISVPGVRTRAAVGQIMAKWMEHRREGKWAVVLPSEAARLSAEEATRALNLKPAKISCFTSEKAARDWLGVPAKNEA